MYRIETVNMTVQARLNRHETVLKKHFGHGRILHSLLLFVMLMGVLGGVTRRSDEAILYGSGTR